MVAVQRFHHHRHADPLGRAHRLARGLNHALLRHRQAKVVQHVVRVFLVARNLDRDMLGLAGDGGLNALLVLAMAGKAQHSRVEVEANRLSVGASASRVPMVLTGVLMCRSG